MALLCSLLTMVPSALEAHLDSAPTEAGATPDLPIERVTSELVLIEAYITDVHGLVIEGLRPEDFVMTIDGLVKPISSLEFLNVGPTAPVSTSLSGPAPIPLETVTLQSTLSRRLVLFFDEATSVPQGMTEARHAALQFLASDLAPSDEVAIVDFDGALRVLRRFTNDRQELRKAIQDQGNQIGHRQPIIDLGREAMDLAMALGDELVPPDLRIPRAASIANRYASQAAAMMRVALAGLRSLADSLSTWPGYKAIVVLGDGIPQNTTAEYFERLGGNPQGSGLLLPADRAAQLRLDQILRNSLAVTRATDLSKEIRGLQEALAADRVTLEAIQTRGGIAVHRTNELKKVAIATGGRSSSTRDLQAALRSAANASRRFYILGYAPEGPPDGRYHSVTLRVKKGVGHLAWRRGFLRLDPAEAERRAIQAAFTAPELHAGLGLDVSLVAGPSDGSRRVVDVAVHLPTDTILYLPEAGRRIARLTVGIVSVDEDTQKTLRVTRDVRIALPTDRPIGPSLGLNLVSRVQLSTRTQTITVVVSDRIAGSTAATRFQIGPQIHDSKVLGLSIYSLAENSLWIDLPATEAKGGVETPAQYTIGPALRTTFTTGEPLLCGFKLRDLPDKSSPLLRVVIRKGANTLRTQEATANSHLPNGTIEVKLPMDGVPPGDYLVGVQEILPTGTVDLATMPLGLRATDGPTIE